MSLSANYPALAPNLLLDFANSKVVDPRITVTRASTATYFNQLGVLQTAQNNVPRIDFNPTTYACNGLLVEEQRTNLLLQSQDFATTWVNSSSTEQTDVATAPDGTATADSLTDTVDAVNTTHAILQTVTFASGIQYTLSVYAKADTLPGIQLLLPSAAFGADQRANYDCTSGTVSNVAGTATLSIISVGNGWYRCLMTATATASTSGVLQIRLIKNVSGSLASFYIGDGTGKSLIWGAQLEAGAFATSYIPTTTTALTRQADAVSLTGTNFSSWYNAVEGTLFAQWSKIGSLNFQSMFGVSDGTTNNVIIMAHGSGAPTNNARFDVNVSGSSQASLTMIIGSAVNTVYKTIGAYKANDFAAVAGGGAIQTDGTGTIPTATQAAIGANGAVNGGFLCGHIQRISYYPLRNTNTQLQALTGS